MRECKSAKFQAQKEREKCKDQKARAGEIAGGRLLAKLMMRLQGEAAGEDA
jgi:hypothetical protein